jgi:uncharacterized LabA/DUF88 family protein
VAFFDGQNLFNAAKRAFKYSYPNYDPNALAKCVCDSRGWTLTQVRFYTGIPDKTEDYPRYAFWTAKLAQMGRQGIIPFSRTLRYQDAPILGGSKRQGHEKGIDVRIALDIVRGAFDYTYDVAVLFSQDQDLSEVADEVKRIAHLKGRWLKLACAFPAGTGRGIEGTDWIRLDRAQYDACLDPRDYRIRNVQAFNPPRLSD